MKKLRFILFPAIALAVGGLSAYLSRAGMESVYPNLEKSALSPPGIVFPIVWSILYVLMGISLALVVNKGGKGVIPAVLIWFVQLAVNFSWSLFFFRWNEYFYALICLAVLWILIAAMILLFHRVSKGAALLQIPYLLWVSFAAYLNYTIWMLNP